MNTSSQLRALNTIFVENGFEMRMAGGCVRDTLLGLAPKDVDLCTDARPDEMIVLAEKTGLRLIPTGLQHGTVSFVLGDRDAPEIYEVTTLRIDAECDGRHAEVSFTRDWEADAARRDLSINAMMMDFEGNLYDWHGGRDDLAAGVIRFVGEPSERILEDYLRILRFFRFADKFPDSAPVTMDPKALDAIAVHAEGLQRISVERIWAEIRKITGGKRAADTLQSMFEHHVLPTIRMPWIDPTAAAFTRQAGASALAVMASQIEEVEAAEELAVRWRMSREERDTLEFLVHYRNQASPELFEDLLVDGAPRYRVIDLSRLAGVGHQVAETFVPPVFPVQGRDLLDRGFKPGPALGAAMKDLRKLWVGSRFQMSRSDLLALL